jgi:hypothetical protein
MVVKKHELIAQSMLSIVQLFGSIFAGQHNYGIRVVQFDLIQWKIGVFNRLPVNCIAVTILAGKRRGIISIDYQYPELERFGFHLML